MKTIIVKECGECPYHFGLNTGGHFHMCSHSKSTKLFGGKQIKGIPESCPLDDTPKKKGKK